MAECAVVGVTATTARRVEVGIAGKALGAVRMVQDGVEARQTGAGAQEQRQEQ